MTCRFQDAKSYAVPICTKAAMPQACVLAYDRCLGAKWVQR